MIDEQKLRELFEYHAPNDDRKLKYEAANEAAFLYVLAISKLIENPAELTTIVRKVLEIRHAVNQAITYDAVNLAIRDIFKKEDLDIEEFRKMVDKRIQETIRQEQMPGRLLDER